MQKQVHTGNRLFLFNPVHSGFVEGQDAVFPGAITRRVAVRQFAFLLLIIAFPIMIVITVLAALADYDIHLLLLAELLTALIVCAYFVLRGYLRDRVLRYDGRIIYGEIIRQDILPGYASIGAQTVTRVFYRFLTPDNERVISSIDLPYAMQRFPDGRKYPEPGTPVAILYANPTTHKLL